MNNHVDLIDQIDFQAVECLNQKPDHTLANALKQGYREDDGLYLESDCDEQLLCHIGFKGAAKLSSVIIKGPADSGPKNVKLFVNEPTIGFSEAESSAGVQSFALSKANLEGEPVQLKFVKFQKVHTLTILIADNQDDEDETRVTKVSIMGVVPDSFNVADIKSQEDLAKQQG